MRDYSLSHVSDAVLVRDLSAIVSRERVTIAEVLAHIGEIDARKLYASAGYSSMFVYCVEKLHFSEDETGKRIHAARAARQYPILFTALAGGRLHLTAVCLLAPHLSPETVAELAETASHRSKSEIEDILAARYRLPPPPPRTPTAQCVLAPEHAPEHVGALQSQSEHVPEHVAGALSPSTQVPEHVVVFGSATQHVPGPEPTPAPLCQLTVRQSTRDKLRYAQAMLSHAIPSGDPSDVLDRALDLLIARTQTRRFGAPRKDESRRARATGRYIPAEVRRAVWERDQGQCTFVGTEGHRCRTKAYLQFDHITPFAKRRDTSADGLRLRCRTHNQLEADRTFGVDFMTRKRKEARLAAGRARARTNVERSHARRSPLSRHEGKG